MKKAIWAGVLASMMLVASSLSLAAADKKIVLQISDADLGKQNLVLNVASNLQKSYGLANVDIEIVAFGPGLKLLIPNPKDKGSMKVQGRINNLAANQIRFSACNNTLMKMTKKAGGKKPKLNKNSQIVDAGVVRIIELQEKGYTLVRP